MSDTNDMESKLTRLRALLRETGGFAVAFSSCVDSTFLLKFAHEELGDRVVAVTARSRGDIARIELCAADIPRAVEQREKIHDALKGFGFAYVVLDLLGYRTGSMNETLTRRKQWTLAN